MKLMKRTGIYKASNSSFDPKEIKALSYNWWVFVKVINGLTVFNEHRYSVTTSKHQRDVRRLMGELGIKIDLTVSCVESLAGFENIKQVKDAHATQVKHDAAEAESKRLARLARAKQRRAENRLAMAA